MDIYLHGIDTVEKNNGPRPVQTIDTGIIGLIGTAPDADANLWPLDTPVPVYGISDVITGLGATGTIPDALISIFTQATRVSPTVVVVRVAPGANNAELIANIIGSIISKTGMQAFRKAYSLIGLKPKILIAPGVTGLRATEGVTGITVTTPGSGYTTAPTVAIAGAGTGALAHAVILNGAVTGVVIDNPGFGYSGSPTVSFSGGGGTGAAGTVQHGSAANAVAINLVTVANSLRAVAFVDGPNTTSTDAVAYRNDFDTDRLLIIDPMVKASRGGGVATLPAAPFIAGLQARIDYEEGFWFSPSNHVIEGCLGSGRPIEHSLSDPSAESQFLNRNDIATVIRSPSGGWKLWGSRVPCSDTIKKFLSVRRSHDTIIESIEIAHEPFLDKPFSIQSLTDISETVNQALRRWKALGATLGGRVWFDLGLNTKESWATGRLYVSYDAEAPAPIEHITFVFNRNTGYYEQLGQDAIREISRLSGLAVSSI